jgi:hypothetical protein
VYSEDVTHKEQASATDADLPVVNI